MNLKEFGECIEFNIKHNIKHSVLGLGAPGIGKSQIIRQIGEKYGYKVIDIRLAQMSEVEIGGLIYPNEDKTKTRWLAPEILPDVKRDGEKTILLLDEITSCSRRVQVAAYQLVLDRRVGQYTLPEGTFVIALGNREDDDGVYVRLSSPLADRFEIHNIDIDFEIWKNDYAYKHNIHPYVIKYLDYNHSALHTQSENPDSMVFATPRSWERVSDILKVDQDISKAVIYNKIAGNVGEDQSRQFISFCRSNDVRVGVEEFLNGMTAPTEPEQVAVLIDNLVSRAGFIKGKPDAGYLNTDQKELLDRILGAIFRFENSEYIMLGLRRVTDINPDMVKNALAELDNPDVVRFVRGDGKR